MKKLALVLVAFAVALGAPAAARADGGQDNAAVAVNTKDGSSLFKLAFKIRKVAGDVVNAQNAAVSYASCTSCRTTAIAFEIVLVTGSPSTFTPSNYAIAINENCTLCSTFATAYQWVVQVPDGARFTSDGRRELAEIYSQLRKLKKQDLSPAELDARTRELAARVKQVLNTEIVAKPEEPDADETTGGEETTDETLTNTGPATTQPAPGGNTTSTPTTTTGSTTTTGTTPTTSTGSTTTTGTTTSTTGETTTGTTTTQ